MSTPLSISSVQDLLSDELAALATEVRTLLASHSPLLQDLAQHTFQDPGKQLRPTLVFLSAGACGGITPKSRRGALMLTLLHQASLVHDDVVDGAAQRRGRPAIHIAWNHKIAVLFGDYLVTTGLRLATQNRDYDLLALVTETAQTMSEGELLHLEQTQKRTITEALYLDIIYKKTAHLLGGCCAVGARAAGASEGQVVMLRQAGEDLGMAFQLKDDWLDYGTEAQGKPLGLDLQAGYLTLPLIHALQAASQAQRQEVMQILQQQQTDPHQRQAVMDFVRQSPGPDYTRQKMGHYQQKAVGALANLPTSAYQQALLALIRDIV